MNHTAIVFSVEGVMCISCKHVIESTKRQLETRMGCSFDVFSVDVASKTLTVKIPQNDHHNEAQMVDAIISILDDNGHHAKLCPDMLLNHRAKDVRKKHSYHAFASLFFGFFYIFMACNLMVLPLWVLSYLPFLSAGLMLYFAWPFIQSAWHKLKTGWMQPKSPGLFNMDSLFVLTGGLILGSSLVHVWFPMMPSLFEAGFLIFGFRHLGCLFQGFLDKKIQFKPLKSVLLDKKYMTASGDEKKASALKVDDRIVLKKGDIFPRDGKVVALSSDLCLRDMLGTGSFRYLPTPLNGDRIFAGVEVMQGNIEVELLNSSRMEDLDAQYQKIQVTQQDSELQQQMEKALGWFIPGVVLFSLLTGVILSPFFPLAVVLKCMCSILVSACPCTLGLIVPMALQMGARLAIKKGIIYHDSHVIELAAKVDAFVFDYHGTLTKSEVEIGDLIYTLEVDEKMKKTYLERLYALEQAMLKDKPNLIGQAILKKLESLSLGDIEEGLDDCFVHLGFGAKMGFKEGTYCFGNNEILEELGLDIVHALANRLYFVFIPADGLAQCLAYMDIGNEIKDDAKAMIKSLQEKGKKVFICTGADKETAVEIEHHFALPSQDIHHGCRMDMKSSFIADLKARHPLWTIAMVGDGINDKAAFKESHISVLLNHDKVNQNYQSQLKEEVNIIVESGLLSDMYYPFDIAELTVSLIWKNIYFSLIYNCLSLGLSCAFLLILGISLPPALGVCLMIIQSAILTWYTYTLLVPQPHENDDFLSKQGALMSFNKT